MSRAECRRTSAGFSLIELMVGIVVGTVCTAGMLLAFAAFEGQKRSTVAGNDAQQQGSFAMHLLERQVRSAGAAIVQGRNYGVWGCTLQVWNDDGAHILPRVSPWGAPFAGWPRTLRAVPVLVAAGPGESSDALGIMHGDSAVRVFKAGVESVSGTSVWLDGTLGFRAGDHVLLSDRSGGCTLGKAAVVDDVIRTLSLGSGSPPGGFGGRYDGDGFLFDLGPEPAYTLYGVDTGRASLVALDALGAQVSEDVAGDVVAIKALYGVDDGANGGVAGDGVVDAWVRPTGAWSIERLSPEGPDTGEAQDARARILALRVALVVRAPQPERQSSVATGNGQGDTFIGYTGDTSLVLFADRPDAALRIPTSTRYRYRVHDTTIPLRNALVNRFF